MDFKQISYLFVAYQIYCNVWRVIVGIKGHALDKGNLFSACRHRQFHSHCAAKLLP